MASVYFTSAPVTAQRGECYLPEKPIDYGLARTDPLYEFARDEFQTYLEELEAYLRCLEHERSTAFYELRDGYEEFQRIYGADAVFRSAVPEYSIPR